MKQPIINNIAMLFLRPVTGRVIGALPVVVPGAMAILLSLERGCYFELSLVVVSSLPFLLIAFLLHEAGHLLVFLVLGLRGRLVYSPIIDVRAVPVGDSVEHSTGSRLLCRALGGWLINVTSAVLLSVVALMADGLVQIMCLWAAAWQGVSALTVTAWAVHSPLTDAASLAKAIAIVDSVEFKQLGRGEFHVRVELHRTTDYLRPPQFDDNWWIMVRGLDSIEVKGAKMMILPHGSDTLLLLRSQDTKIEFRLYGEVQGDCIQSVTRGGQIIRLPIIEEGRADQ